MKAKKIKKILLIVLPLILVLHVVLSFVSFYYFHTINYFKSFYAISLIASGKETYVEISGGPDWVIIGEAAYSVYDRFLTENGYEEIEDKRMGLIHYIVKEGDEEVIIWDVHIASDEALHYSVIHT